MQSFAYNLETKEHHWVNAVSHKDSIKGKYLVWHFDDVIGWERGDGHCCVGIYPTPITWSRFDIR